MDRSRGLHYLLIALVWASVTLPNLGGPSLWDVDEGNNAEAAREMLLSGDWVVPYFNFVLRPDKPALLYWCQVASYSLLGVNEFAARFPSALAALLLALVVYELGRYQLSATTGLLAGIGLPTCWLLCGAARFANPDALLVLSLTLAFAWFWVWYRGVAWAALPMGASIGLGVLAKGPVALVMPLAIWTLFLLWHGQYWRGWTLSFFLGMVVAVLVGAPWYVWVAADTHGEWVKQFWMQHNQGRFLNAMESHGGPIVYYLPVLLLGLAPWSLFLIPALIDAVRRCWSPVEEGQLAQREWTRYLLVWIGVYVGFFSLAATKLPNYVLPVYPALMMLLADRLERWRKGEAFPTWVLPSVFVLQGLTALGLVLGFLLTESLLPGLRGLALLALLPLVSLVVLAWLARGDQRTAFVVAFAGLAVLSTGAIVVATPEVMEPHKPIKTFVALLPEDRPLREVRLLTHRYFQPSLVFYSRRYVETIAEAEDVAVALRTTQPVYVLMPRPDWDSLRRDWPDLAHEVAAQRDFARRCEVVLVTNDTHTPAGSAE